LTGEGRGEGELKEKNLTALARGLRNRATDAENLLWRHFRAKQLSGLKFRRQAQIGNYIVDFVCFENKLVIEVDGGQHASKLNDKERERWLKKRGFKVIRFWNNDVLKDIESVLRSVWEEISISPSP